ncbi:MULTISPECIES: bifunctional methylenetetrahydrofolate dehydrogenase/methenyltetrahydrofolate cyclohydrolase FolD [Cetobacterium]|jgi:methylenetetrahydrofolate dehydrogenase (NADP+)/methenyltetrahydrofolate cyclohydrolase|uniref:Bifunctional protein FolD n=1 Tax=Cetobacterium somerae ATCC BAA-474 TaxID=1319815 RepID=U7VA61_9FUSO|nr:MULTISPECIES: bifunctional methylenetetrahydrofolate dehydrogenase/methenyltetrahydrofolate cyclohydrolase FolD [Cetobacterium]ERT67648.1 tetrahydrofolate dehydrogenase/cyclohydrolase, NAD(P)-binding domain protein [Cetobacterium somerae ATCC BAA-474]MBC2853824.1 bifunctional methylenetetrahydrofolate dehydrogenase/methenyltetrahydrofolate cyclohydrolase FolD [Cetobacterium sp. 2G large]MCQ9625613.1 bifunctional methylenetetrahydrofolate dehydrogenase/methenyltetrahydrofolate cyclohydrolase F
MKILDGKYVSQKVRDLIKKEIIEIKEVKGTVPGLAVIQAGDNLASKIYVNSKIKQCAEVGIESKNFIMPADVTEEELLRKIEELNSDETVDGILVQLPLPDHIDTPKVIEAIDINKDVDGFKPENLGKVVLGDETALISCTPAGILRLFEEYEIALEGKDIVVIGRSNIVGKPMTALLINEGATVTVCNSKTKNLAEKTKNADVVIVAIGKANFLKGDMIKTGAIIIDVGINRDENNKICGDVDFESVKEKVSYITPVPGGVGPMTIAMLLNNTLKAFKIGKKI